MNNSGRADNLYFSLLFSTKLSKKYSSVNFTYRYLYSYLSLLKQLIANKQVVKDFVELDF